MTPFSKLKITGMVALVLSSSATSAGIFSSNAYKQLSCRLRLLTLTEAKRELLNLHIGTIHFRDAPNASYKIETDGIRYKYADGTEVLRADESAVVYEKNFVGTYKEGAKFPITDRDFQGRDSSPISTLPVSHLAPEELKGKVVLDAGCGRGTYVQQLRDANVEAYGIDMALNEKQLEKGFYFAQKIPRLAFTDAQFDVVFSRFNVFYYNLSDQTLIIKTLQEFSRILKPGGEIRIDGIAEFLLSDRFEDLEKMVKKVSDLEVIHYEFGPYDRTSFADRFKWMVIRKKQR